MAERQYRRQLATILSIDAVGYSRLMDIDDEEALDAFQERAALISQECERLGGSMFGDAGDSLMASFGNPVDALRAAQSFQVRLQNLNAGAREVRRMPFRVGVNTGDVIVAEGRMFGHDVNIAARLQEVAPANGVVVSETTWYHARGMTGFYFVDLGEQHMKNIREPVHAYLVRQSGDESDIVAPYEAPVVARAGAPAVAVLPLRSDAGDAGTEYLGIAVSEDIVTGLSHVRWLPVISLNSSAQFDTDDVSPFAAGRALGARYIVSGRISQRDTQLRLTLTLDDVSSGRTIWSRRYNRDSDAIRAMQDEIGGEIVSTLANELDRAEQVRSFHLPWENLGTWQLVARGRFHMSRRTSADTMLAFEFFTKAYSKDPNSSAVLNELAWWHFWRGFQSLDEGAFDKVVEYSRRALFMDSQDARPYAHLGATAIMRHDPASAREYLEEALSINPSFAFASSTLGSAHLLLGDPRTGIPFLLEADRLSPFDLYRFHNQGQLAAAYTAAEDWEQAVAAASRSLRLSPGYWYSRFLKIGGLARLGRVDEAREDLEIMLERWPEFSLKKAQWIPFVDPKFNEQAIANFRLVARDRVQ